VEGILLIIDFLDKNLDIYLKSLANLEEVLLKIGPSCEILDNYLGV
jgi:hypothetical protein